jgi:hypothetical protein
MESTVTLPKDFSDYLSIENAALRFREAVEVAEKITARGVELFPNLDHAAIFTDPPYLVAGPLKQLGYVSGWDARCYPSPVDGCDYINVSARLPEDSSARGRGWFDYVAVVHPVDEPALSHMLSQGYGNPFIHHLTWGLVPPPRTSKDNFEYASRLVPFVVEKQNLICEVTGVERGKLIVALPQEVIDHPDFGESLPIWLEGLGPDECDVELMDGGGFFIQFFVLTGRSIEIVLRVDTRQAFNAKSLDKISEHRIITVQGNSALLK